MDSALTALRARAGDIAKVARRWVEQNSHTQTVANVARMGELLQEDFSFPALALEVIPGKDFADHLVWRTPAALRAPPILLVGHHDTVFPPGTFEGWTEDGDRATGPGALDMKGGWAIVHAALAALDEAGALADIPIVVVSVSEEELGSPESQPHLVRLANSARCGLVFEAGRAGDGIITRRRGSGFVRATAKGVAAHAGNHHEDGANAIWALARFIDRIQPLTDYARGVTVNVGLVEGGTSKNTVPDRAVCDVDLRFERERDAERLLASIHTAAAELGVPGTRLFLDGGVRRHPMEKTPATEALYREYADCQREAGLGDVEAPLIGGGSDANTLASAGVPVIDGLGPRGAGFHTDKEHIELSSLPKKAEALLRFLWRHRTSQ